MDPRAFMDEDLPQAASQPVSGDKENRSEQKLSLMTRKRRNSETLSSNKKSKQPQGKIGLLYQDVLGAVFLYLNPEEMKMAQRVCQSYQRAMRAPNLLKARLERGDSTTEMLLSPKEAVELARTFPHLRCFNLTQRCAFSFEEGKRTRYAQDLDMRALVERCQSLTAFRLESASLVTDGGLRLLASLPLLSRLSLSVQRVFHVNPAAPLITHNAVSTISACRRLRDLTLINGDEEFTAHLGGLAALVELRRLKLVGFTSLRDENLAFLVAFPRFRALEVLRAQQLDGSFLKYLGELAEFSHLSLYRSQLVKTNLAYLLTLRALRRLEISQCGTYAADVYAAYLPQLAFFKLNGTENLLEAHRRHL